MQSVLDERQVGQAVQSDPDVQAFVDNGCREFVLWFRDYPATESMRRFMAEVVPRVTDHTTA